MDNIDKRSGLTTLGIIVAALVVLMVAAGVGYGVWYYQDASAANSEDAAKCKNSAEGALSVGRYDSPALIRIDNQPDPSTDNTAAPPSNGPVLICTGVGFFNDGYKAPIEYGMVNEDGEVVFMYRQTGDLERVQ